jgi:hypothetical protein
LIVTPPDDPTPNPHIDESTNFNGDLTVTDKPYVTPRRASPKSDLRLPRLPSDSLLSFMTGKQISAEVEIDEQGVATVKQQVQCPPGTPDFIRAQVVRILQTTRWNPALNSRGEAVKDSRLVILSWQKQSAQVAH